MKSWLHCSGEYRRQRTVGGGVPLVVLVAGQAALKTKIPPVLTSSEALDGIGGWRRRSSSWFCFLLRRRWGFYLVPAAADLGGDGGAVWRHLWRRRGWADRRRYG
ncbi:uncharacterized protein LOC124894218 [Capsicum annuum]|uniref:uncharacterized protein LOC124894218 n=1 Tax=Capsicum annuum TaxID=4072 RepID=UPI001FB16687|nr:uncharacterized protein LOC124894218 [Capsicum annuum]